MNPHTNIIIRFLDALTWKNRTVALRDTHSLCWSLICNPASIPRITTLCLLGCVISTAIHIYANTPAKAWQVSIPNPPVKWMEYKRGIWETKHILKAPEIGQNWSVWSYQKHNFPNGQVHSKTDTEQNQSMTSTQRCVKKQKIATLFYTYKNLNLLFYYYFNAETVVPVLIIGLNELKWDSPGSCWHNEWLCGEAQNVNDEEF